MRFVLGLLVLTLHGCGGVLTWETVYSSASSDRHAELRVQRTNCFGDCEVQIVVVRGWREQQIAHRFDCAVQFAHASWSGSVVAVFVDGSFCGQIKVAYDTATQRTVDFESASSWLKPAIIHAYRVTADELQANKGDVFLWATDPADRRHRAAHEFRAR